MIRARPRTFRHRDETGTGGTEGLAFGVLIFVFGTLLITNAWGVIDAKMAANTAAREAARAYVEASDWNTAQAAASSAANSAMSGHGKVVTNLHVAIPTGTSYSRCQAIEVTAETKIPRVALPLISGTGGTYTVSSKHAEIVDPYRSGLPGIADCA